MIYETNPHRYNGRFAIAILLAAALLAMSCNPVKRVMRDPGKFDKVGQAWLRAQPTPMGIPEDTVVIGTPDTTWHEWGINPDGSLWFSDAIDTTYWRNDTLFGYSPGYGEYYTGLVKNREHIKQNSETRKDCPPCPKISPSITKPKTVFATPQSVKHQLKILQGKLELSQQDHSRDTALLRADIVRVNGLLDNMTERRDKWRNRAISTWVLLGLIVAGYLIARKHIA